MDVPTRCKPIALQEQFWRENVGHFEEKDFQILRVLVKLLEAGREPRTLAVACHDLGHFITYYPGGKGIVTGERLHFHTPRNPSFGVLT